MLIVLYTSSLVVSTQAKDTFLVVYNSVTTRSNVTGFGNVVEPFVHLIFSSPELSSGGIHNICNSSESIPELYLMVLCNEVSRRESNKGFT